MSTIDHQQRCREAADAIAAIWSAPLADNTPKAVRYARLASVLFKQNEGKQGAGLTGGQQQEVLFRDMLTSSDARFAETGVGALKDADYVFEGYPLSHKTIGFSGSGDLALGWSKNGPTGLLRNEFKASMVIMNFRDPAKAGALKGLRQGAYVVPLDFLRTEIKFSSNNKTDSLISAKETARAMKHAAENMFFVPLVYRHTEGVGVRVSLWHTGAGKLAPPLA